MPLIQKQLKITKLIRKTAITRQTECSEELQEIQKLEQMLQEKHNELFQILRNKNKSRMKVSVPKTKASDTEFNNPQKIILATSVETTKRNIELMSMLTGVEVQSYVAEDHFCVLFHMQHQSDTVVKYGLRIDTRSDGDEITKSTLPVGFNLKAVVEEFDKITRPKCLSAIRRALVAYHDRLYQYEALKDLLNVDANLFKVLDGTHIVISFLVQSNDEDDDEEIQAFLMLDYRVHDIRPKTFSFREEGLPEDVYEILMQQCLPFKKKPLRKAFKDAFINDIGQYRLVRQGVLKPEEQEHRQTKRFRPNKNNNYNNDDTFVPEDCTDQSDGEQSE